MTKTHGRRDMRDGVRDSRRKDRSETLRRKTIRANKYGV